MLNNKILILRGVGLLIITIALFSCKEDNAIVPYSNIYNLPETPYNYSNVIFPETFTSFVLGSLDNTPDDNPITDNGATLGRVLFYDKNLSFNNTIACASCHLQENGFSDPNQLSVGFEGGHTGRNSMPIINARFYEKGKFFWDHRANTLENQVLMPFQDGIEMGMTIDLLVNRVSSYDYYEPLFIKAFSSNEVTSDKIAKALAQFIRAIYSFNSKYDIGIEATHNIFEDFPNFTAQENLGKDIFNGKLTPTVNGNCAFCHMANLNTLHFSAEPTPFQDYNQVVFAGLVTDNIGLDAHDHGDSDNGEGLITENLYDNGKFKTPSIRNIALTAPYMHDGRFNTLEEVVEHYSTGVKNHPNLSNHMINADSSPRHLNLTETEKAGLVAFLKTLTDNTLATDQKYANPFVD